MVARDVVVPSRRFRFNLGSIPSTANNVEREVSHRQVAAQGIKYKDVSLPFYCVRDLFMTNHWKICRSIDSVQNNSTHASDFTYK